MPISQPPGPVLTASVLLTPAQIATLGSVKVDAEPGVDGKFYNPIAMTVSWNGNAVPPGSNLEMLLLVAGQTVFSAGFAGDEDGAIRAQLNESSTALSLAAVLGQPMMLSSDGDIGVLGPVTSAAIPSGISGGQQYIVGDVQAVLSGTNDAAVTVIAVAAGGFGNAIGDIFAIAAGDGTATATAVTVDENGSVETLSLTTPGTGYITATNLASIAIGSGLGPTVDIIADPDTGLITGVVLSATGGTATAVEISAPGTWYKSASGASTVATTGIGLGLILDVTVALPGATGTAKVDILYTLNDPPPALPS